MLAFTRNKLVSVYRKGENSLVAHGVLEDDIYGLEIDVTLSLPDLEIASIKGEWRRAENVECVRAIPFLQEAVGFRMDEDFTQRVQKIVGRKACRHFAAIILECCYAARDAAEVIAWEKEREKRPDIRLDDLRHEKEGKRRPPRPPGEPPISRAGASAPRKAFFPEGRKQDESGQVIDLHVHTFPASPCSSVAVDAVIEEAKRIGLDGICLTDHNTLWDPGVVADLREKHGFLVLRGNEITTDQGDMLVFGLERDIKGIIKLEELREAVSQEGGFIVVAHPFRGFLTFGVGRLGLTPEKAMERSLFKLVDAVEVMNSKVTEKENRFSATVAAGLGLPVTGGSDAHELDAVGIYATRFYHPIRDEKGLIEALKSGRYRPVAFRKERSA